MVTVACRYCGVITESIDGPVHRYLLSTPGCWSEYGRLLAEEYGDPAYFVKHGLTVDAYALQHPGVVGPQTVRSANIHLASLFSYFELGYRAEQLVRVKQWIAAHRDEYQWLEPPVGMVEMNVGSVVDAVGLGPEVYGDSIEEWARYVFDCWGGYHGVARGIVEKFI